MDNRPSNSDFNFEDTFPVDESTWQGSFDWDNEAFVVHDYDDGSFGLPIDNFGGPGSAGLPMNGFHMNATFSGASSLEDWQAPLLPSLTNSSSLQSANLQPDLGGSFPSQSNSLDDDDNVFPDYFDNFHVDSAPGSYDNGNLVLPSRPKIPETNTTRKAPVSAPISIPRGAQIKQRRRRTSSGASSASAQKWIQYKPDEAKNRLVTFSETNQGIVRKNNRGRTGRLSPSARKEAAAMRIIGACDSCRRRKEKCDPGTPCKSCVEHFKCDLLLQPCRGSYLEDIAAILLPDQLSWHPSSRSLESFLGPGNFIVTPNVYNLPLSLGFGPCMYLSMKVVYPLELDKLVHRHVVYPWPPQPGMTPASGTVWIHAVLPVVLASTDGAQRWLDSHLTLLVNEHFQSFPLYDSPLKVLMNIYSFYVRMGRPTILLIALKFLVLTHMAGGAFVPVSDKIVCNIIRGTLHSVPPALAADPTPCFIRGQLGAEIPALASTLLRNLLARLERIALSRQCNKWPVVLASMAVLFMAMESIQYKAAKEEYHISMKNRKDADPAPAMRRAFSTASNASASSASSSFSTAAFPNAGFSTSHGSVVDINDEAINAILRFYHNCFNGCHEKLALPTLPARPLLMAPTLSSYPIHFPHQHTHSFDGHDPGAAPIAVTSVSAPQTGTDESAAEARFVGGLRTAIANAKDYLGERKEAKSSDMTGFFDRLLARLFT